MTSPQHTIPAVIRPSGSSDVDRICACGCGASLDGLRADARYASEACKKRAQRAAIRDKAGTGPHPLQEVRDQAALDKHTRDLNGLIRQAIIDTIKTRGECHADDLVDLYPAGEVDRCRELATRQFASLRSGKNPLIAERERRPSMIKARKRGKSGVYIFTPAGRIHYGIVGLDAGGDGLPRATGVQSGENHSEDTEGNRSISPVGSLDRPDGSLELPSDGAVSSAATGAGHHPGKCDQGSPPAATVAACTGSSPDQLVEKLCEEFDAEVVEESSEPETLFGSVPSAYNVIEEAA